mgnify:CR=1 FL=1
MRYAPSGVRGSVLRVAALALGATLLLGPTARAEPPALGEGAPAAAEQRYHIGVGL